MYLATDESSNGRHEGRTSDFTADDWLAVPTAFPKTVTAVPNTGADEATGYFAHIADRGLDSSTSQLNLSRFSPSKHPFKP